MKEGKMVALVPTGLAHRFHCTRDNAWSKWFRSIMRTFKETGAQIQETIIDADGNLNIRYLY